MEERRKGGEERKEGIKKGGMEKEGTVKTHEGQFDPGRQHKG